MLETKRVEMGDIYQSYPERDIESLLNLQKTDRFTSLVRILASQVGKLVNVSELSNILNLAAQTVNDYL